MNIYVSGPMTGLPEFNFPAFDEVSAALRTAGHAVFSPADNDRVRWLALGVEDIKTVPGFTAGDAWEYGKHSQDISTESLFRDDFNYIVNGCNLMVMLNGWEKSTGARYERAIAEALNIPIVRLGTAADIGNPLGGFEVGGLVFVNDDAEKRITKHLSYFPEAVELEGSDRG